MLCLIAGIIIKRSKGVSLAKLVHVLEAVVVCPLMMRSKNDAA